MTNKYKEYWEIRKKDWHEFKLGEYHVSTVGCNHSHLDKDEHYGPCIRKAWYEIKNPIEDYLTSKGNKEIGNILHEVAQKIYKKNHPNSIIEFPLKTFIGFVRCPPPFQWLKIKIYSVGSIDLVISKGPKCNDFRVIYDIADFKTASAFTLPKKGETANPTYSDQTKIYSHEFYRLMKPDMVMIDNRKIIYINKHNLKTIEKIEKYNYKECSNAFINHCLRCIRLHEHVIYNTLPKKEPMKWCKYCKYRSLCIRNIRYEGEKSDLTEEDLMRIFEEETSKKAMWHGKKTKGFIEWKNGELSDKEE